MTQDLKFSIVRQITTPFVFPVANIGDESKIRFVISNAAGGNTILVRARIVGQDDWDLLATITGTSKTVVNVETYDELQVECTVYSSTLNNVKVAASSFNEAGGSTSIDAPAGDNVSASTINFTSSDNSVTITGNSGTNSIDFVAVGGGGAAVKYVKTLVLADWTGPTGGEYIVTIPFSFHAKTDPVVTCMESVAGEFEVVNTSIVLTGNDVRIIALASPDTRFEGKIFIE